MSLTTRKVVQKMWSLGDKSRRLRGCTCGAWPLRRVEVPECCN
jgi:hypothetical protein